MSIVALDPHPTVDPFAVGTLAHLEAERYVLGACLLDPDFAVPRVVAALTVEDFSSPAHQEVFAAITDLWVDGQPVDIHLVEKALARNGTLARIGGAAALFGLLQAVPTSVNVSYYANTVADMAGFRRMATAATRIMQSTVEAARHGRDLAPVQSTALDTLTAAIDTTGPRDQVHDGTAVTDAVVDRLWDIVNGTAVADVGVSTGLATLDDAIGGLEPGHLTVIGGYPAMGKSVVGDQIAFHIAETTGIPALIYSLEMRESVIRTRLLSHLASVPVHHLRRGTVTREQMVRIEAARDRLNAVPLHIVDDSSLTITDLAARTRMFARRHGTPSVVLVDHLGLVSPSRNHGTRENEIAENSRTLKQLAHDQPVIALSQLNRGAANRPGKVPTMFDLRDSGMVEADADTILLLHRPDAYDETDRAGELDVIVGKARHERTGTVTLAHQYHYCRVADLGHL